MEQAGGQAEGEQSPLAGVSARTHLHRIDFAVSAESIFSLEWHK